MFEFNLLKMGERPHLSAVSSDQTLEWPETDTLSPFSLLRNRSLSQQGRPNVRCNSFKLGLFVCLAAVSLISTCPGLTPFPSVGGIPILQTHYTLGVPSGCPAGTLEMEAFLPAGPGGRTSGPGVGGRLPEWHFCPSCVSCWSFPLIVFGAICLLVFL